MPGVNDQPRRPRRPDEPPEEAELKPDWKDVFAMTIAAYQVLFPVLLALVGAMLAMYLLVTLVFR